jgi:hypothetical protein
MTIAYPLADRREAMNEYDLAHPALYMLFHTEHVDDPWKEYRPASYEGYHRFVDSDGSRYGSFCVYFHMGDVEGERVAPGWYWNTQHPGCLPDSDPVGPFKTAKEAWDNAQGG